MKKVASVVRVDVSLREGLTILDLKDGNTTKLSEIRQIIKNNGFVSKEATVIAAGREFKVLATNQLGDGFMSSPAVLGNSLVLRSKTHLYRID